MVDTALAGAALHVDVDGVLRDGDLLGRFLDTFVMAQVRAEIGVGGVRFRPYHLRSQQGRHEVDVLLETANGCVIGLEVKAEAAPTAHSARHLRWLRDEFDERFLAGLVLHTGPRALRLADRLLALPICSLWA